MKKFYNLVAWCSHTYEMSVYMAAVFDVLVVSIFVLSFQPNVFGGIWELSAQFKANKAASGMRSPLVQPVCNAKVMLP